MTDSEAETVVAVSSKRRLANSSIDVGFEGPDKLPHSGRRICLHCMEEVSSMKFKFHKSIYYDHVYSHYTTA